VGRGLIVGHLVGYGLALTGITIEDMLHGAEFMAAISAIHHHVTPIIIANITGLLGYSLAKIRAKEYAGTLEIKQAEEKFRSYIQSSPIAVFILNDKGEFMDVNPASYALVEYSEEELLSKKLKNIVHADDFALVLDKQNILKKTGCLSSEIRLLKKDGSIINAKIDAVFLPTGMTLVFCQDISEHKKTIELLFETKNRFKQIIEQSPSVYELYDIEGTQIEVNTAYEKLWEFPEGRERTVNKFNLLRSQEVVDTGLIVQIEKAYAGETVSLPPYSFDPSGETEAKGVGRVRWLNTKIYPLKNRQGRVTNIVITHEDISDRIYAEKENKELQEQIVQSQKLGIIGTLASGIAHDFNNILTPIIGYTHLMHEQKGRSEQDYERLSVISSSARRAKELVGQVLNFSRRAEEEQHPIQLQAQIEDTVSLLRASIPSTIEFSLDLQDQLVLASAARIHQVVLNLCTNAAQAMQETGGRVTIKLTQTEVTADSRTLLPAGRYALLSISDSGPGIAPEVLPQIFDPYFTTKEVGEGTGLGLATVQRILTSLGGNIRVESQLGQGCTFFLQIPLSQSTEMTQKAIVSQDLPEGDKHLLLVDDEESLVSISTEFLQGLGYQVTGLSSSTEALKVFEHQPDRYDLLITDLTMPGMTGMELARKVNGISPELPIILCTGQHDMLKKQNFAGINLLKALQKPDLFTEMAFTIHQHFND
jgi:PAS domain S-box-containing protein